MIINILCLQPPYSAVNKDSYGMKKTWVLYFSAYPIIEALVKPKL